MGHDDLGSSPSEEQIQPPLKKKSKLGEKSDSKSESKGEKKNDDVRKLEGKREKEGVSMDVRLERLRKAISKREKSYLCPGEDSVDYEKWKKIAETIH